MDVLSHTEEHILAKLSHIDWLVALVDDVWVAALPNVRLKDRVVTHPRIELLTTLLGGRLLQFNHLLGEEVLQELVLVADLQKFGALSLVVIEHDLELGYSLLAHAAVPVVDLLMGTVLTVRVR